LLISAIGVIHGDGAGQSAPEGTIFDMKVFSITASNQVRVFASEQEAPAGETVFGSAKQLAALVQEWPMARLEEVWNQLPGAKQIRKFTDRKSGVRRLWQAVQGVAAKAGHQQRRAVLKHQPAPPTAKQSKQGPTPEKGTKTETILALLRQPSGATLTALMRATQWQAHSVRGFISGQLGKRMGLRVKSFRRDGDRIYRLRA
jgi:hypothetical protein